MKNKIIGKVKCSFCGGTGFIESFEIKAGKIINIFEDDDICPKCKGNGFIIRKKKEEENEV